MRGFSIIWRAIRDTFDQILSYMLGSLIWWAVVLIPFSLFAVVAVNLPPIVGEAVLILGVVIGFGPATAVLAKWTDPRLLIDRPALADLGRWARTYAVHAWIVAAIVLFTLGILVLNLSFYASSSSAFALLIPLWLFLIVIAAIVTFIALAAVSLLDVAPKRAFRLAGFVIASAPFQSLLLGLWVVVTVVGGAALVVPLVLLTPPLIMAATNRLLLRQLEIPIIDPNAPTEEREVEKRSGADKRAGRPQRGGLFRRG